MKLFIWKGPGVLSDYTDGMIVAIAPDVETAAVEITKANGWETHAYPHSPTEVIELGNVAAMPKAWVCWGGG